MQFYAAALEASGLPQLRVLLLTGGVPARDQLEQIKRGVHIVVATPGRLMDLLEKKQLSLQLCRFLVCYAPLVVRCPLTI